MHTHIHTHSIMIAIWSCYDRCHYLFLWVLSGCLLPLWGTVTAQWGSNQNKFRSRRSISSCSGKAWRPPAILPLSAYRTNSVWRSRRNEGRGLGEIKYWMQNTDLFDSGGPTGHTAMHRLVHPRPSAKAELRGEGGSYLGVFFLFSLALIVIVCSVNNTHTHTHTHTQTHTHTLRA